ncbi:ExbD/TolR family protein [Pelagibius marinus]|uniref:ExbD/TolR family protein n=1 Tax=Pelagibius marinus TaxID=2762760 RepID=UPI001872894E|nr:biopolymer transporter ExbD [Pelagibius marinus]
MTVPASASLPPIEGTPIRGLGATAFGGAPRRRARIGLTPLIDVVFILLVFFMLASSFLQDRAIQVDAPAARLAGASPEGALLLELRADGLRLSGRPLSEARLAEELRAHAARNPRQRVMLRPAPGVSLQRAVSLLDLVLAAGLPEVSFAGAGAGAGPAG